MTVHFVGAGPGDPDLLTLRGRDRIAACRVCLYAGSLIPDAVLRHAPTDARVVNTAPLSLDGIVAAIEDAHREDLDVCRLHSGDLSVYSALSEQVRRLEALGIPYTITPGVPAFAAASAALGRELTVPEVAQSVVLTRTQGRASAMPPDETLENFARTGSTLALHLSSQSLESVVGRLIPFSGADCPAALVHAVSTPEEQRIRSTLARLPEAAQQVPRRRAIILVGPALAAEGFRDSALYDPAYCRRYRPRT